MKSSLRIGTSGWNYKHWIGSFYPTKLKDSDWLSFYGSHFDTVEINNTFYRLPEEKTFKKWEEATKADFRYSVKVSRFITHIKRLKNIDDALNLFLSRVSLLKNKTGPVLYQLPPSFKINMERLESFLLLLPKNITHVIEFRNDSWFTDEVFVLLKKHHVSFCIHDMSNIDCPCTETSSTIYIRFHGYEGVYEGSYSEDALQKWVNYIKGKLKDGYDVYAYFNNDINAYAVENAKTLKRMLEK